MIDFTTLEQQVLGLDRRSRGRLVSALIRSLDELEESLSPDEQEEIDKLWLIEVQRRDKECDEDPSVLIPFEDVMRDIRQKYGLV